MPGELAHSPAEILRFALMEAGLVNAPDDVPWPAYTDAKADMAGPDNIVVINNTGTGMGFGYTQFDGMRMEYEGIQVRTRSSVPEYGYRILRHIAIWLDENTNQLLVSTEDGEYLIEEVTRSTDVAYVGPASKEDLRPIHSFSATIDVTMLSFDYNLAEFVTDIVEIFSDFGNDAAPASINDTAILKGLFGFNEGTGNTLTGDVSTTDVDEGSGTGTA